LKHCRSNVKLDLTWEDAAFGDVMVAYRAQYPHLNPDQIIGNLPQVKFGDPLPPLLQGSVNQT
jgi:hypothetical protein